MYKKKSYNSPHHISEDMDNIIKKIVDVIGYERFMVLKDWKKAFPREHRETLHFENMQTNKQDSTIVLHIKTSNHIVSLMLQYEKLSILERLRVIVGSSFVSDIKISAK